MKDNRNRPDPWEQSFYETGRTRPPKSHSGLIAALLAIIVFLGGIVSALSLMNIRLFRALPKTPQTDTSFRFSAESTDPPATVSNHIPGIGLSGQEITPFYQHYYRLPHGLYITEVDAGSRAASLGITPGDILLRFADNPVTTPETLESLVRSCSPGDKVPAVIYRNGKQHTLVLTIE